MGIGSLAPEAGRRCILKVAGPAALLVAKVHKVGERLEDPDERRREQLPKDAFDIYRLLRAVETAALASELRLLRSHEVSGRVTAEALSMFEELFGSPSGAGTGLAVTSVGVLEDPAFIAASSVTLSRDLLEAASGE